MTLADQRVIPDHMASYSAYEEGRRKREYLECWRLSFQVTIMHYGACLSWDGWTPTCSESNELIPHFALLPVVVSNCVNPQHFHTWLLLSILKFVSVHKFFTFSLLISLPHPVGEWASGCVGLNHNRLIRDQEVGLGQLVEPGLSFSLHPGKRNNILP